MDGWDPADEAEADHDSARADVADEHDVGDKASGNDVGEFVQEPPALHSQRPLRPAAAGEEQGDGEDGRDGACD